MRIKLAIQFIVLSILLGCNSAKEKVKEIVNEQVLIVSPKAYWTPIIDYNRSHFIPKKDTLKFREEGIISFRVSNSTINDTLNLRSLWEYQDKDTASLTFRATLNLNKNDKLTVSQVEKMIIKLGINDSKLRESLYWLSLLSYAKLVPSKNEFGDILGYYAKAKGEFIPPEYFSIQDDKIIPSSTRIGILEFKKNQLKLKLELRGDGSNKDIYHGFSDMYLEGTEIALTDQRLKPAKGYSIRLYISVDGSVYVRKKGEGFTYFYYQEFFPFESHIEWI